MKLNTPKKKFIFAAVVIGIILLLVVIVSSGGKEQAPGATSQATPTPISGTTSTGTDNLGGVAIGDSGNIDTNKEGAQWKEYKLDSNTSIQFPPKVEIKAGGNGNTIVNVGIPAEDNLENSYDLTLHINIYNKDGNSLYQIANSDLQNELGGPVEQLKPVLEVNYGQHSGYTYAIKGLGRVDYYYFDLGDGRYLRITNYQQNMENNLASEIVANILASLKY